MVEEQLVLLSSPLYFGNTLSTTETLTLNPHALLVCCASVLLDHDVEEVVGVGAVLAVPDTSMSPKNHNYKSTKQAWGGTKATGWAC